MAGWSHCVVLSGLGLGVQTDQADAGLCGLPVSGSGCAPPCQVHRNNRKSFYDPSPLSPTVSWVSGPLRTTKEHGQQQVTEQLRPVPPSTLREEQLVQGGQSACDTGQIQCTCFTSNGHINHQLSTPEHLKLSYQFLRLQKSFDKYSHSITTYFPLTSFNSQFSYMRCSRNSWNCSFIFNTVKNITQSGQVIVAMETIRFFAVSQKVQN